LNQWLIHRVEQETGVGHWTYLEPYSLLQGLWKRLINLSGAEDPLSSSEYGTIFGMYQPVFCSSFHEVSPVRKVDVFVKGAVGMGVLVVVVKWAVNFLDRKYGEVLSTSKDIYVTVTERV
jgi:hypothetical protein